MEIVRVKIVTTPRLLADLLAAALTGPKLRRWLPGDDPALVTIVNADQVDTDSRVTIVLGDGLNDPVAVIVDGQRLSVAATRPHELPALVLELANRLPSDPGAIGVCVG